TALSTAGRYAASVWHDSRAHKGGVTIFDLATGQQVGKCDRLELVSNSVALSPNGKMLASGAWGRSESTYVNLWHLPDGKLAKKLEWPSRSAAAPRSIPSGTSIVPIAVSIAFSPSAGYLAAIWYEGLNKAYVVLWEIKSGHGKILATFDHWIRWIAFSSDGKMFAYPSGDNKVTVLNLADQTSIHIALPNPFIGALE